MLVYFFQKSLQWWCWSWQGESKSCHVHIKMDGPGQRLKKPFFTSNTQRPYLGEHQLAVHLLMPLLQRYRVLKNVVRQGKRRVENCGQILFPAAGPAHPRLCCLCCELEVEKSSIVEDDRGVGKTETLYPSSNTCYICQHVVESVIPQIFE